MNSLVKIIMFLTSGTGMFMALALMILFIVAWWKMFEKAGVEGYKSIIPIYNVYTLCKIVYGNGWIFLIALVPIVNIIFGLVTSYQTARVYGLSPILCVLNIFFAPFITLYIAFSPDVLYQGPSNPMM